MIPSDAIVDLHAHFQLSESGAVIPMRMTNLRNLGDDFRAGVASRLAESDQSSELARRIAELDAGGIDYQVLSITHPMGDQWRTRNPDSEYCRHVNNSLAAFVGEAPDRLGGFAKLDMTDIPGAVIELRRAVEDLGLLGAFLITNFEVDDPDVEPLYREAASLDVPLYLHGNLPGWLPSLYADARMRRRADLAHWVGKEVMGVAGSGDDWGGRYHLGSSFIFMYEEGLTALMLVLSGVLERFPGLRVCFAHSGGTLALALPRVAASLGLHPQLHVGSSDELVELVGRLWFDSDIQSAEALRFVMETLNPEHVVLGTDFPGWGTEPLEHYSRSLATRLSLNSRNLIKLN